jgi:hypothetical protein
MVRLPESLRAAIVALDRRSLRQLVREALAELGRRAGRRGGKWGASGGYARAKALSPKERSEAARRAVMVRWSRAKKAKQPTCRS